MARPGRSGPGGQRGRETRRRILAWPAFSAEDAVEHLNAPRSSVFTAINRLHEAGVIRPLTDRKRDQIWGAGAVLDELDDLNRRIETAARAL